MKVKVVRRFVDKNTRKLMDVGTTNKPTIINITEERYNELVKAGNYVAKAEANEINTNESEKAEIAERTTSDILDDVLNDMTVEELKEHATKYGVNLTGIRNKPEIIEAIKGSGVVANTSEENDSSVDDQNDSEKAINEMSLAELKAYAGEHGVELNGARTKAAIIEAINGSANKEVTEE